MIDVQTTLLSNANLTAEFSVVSGAESNNSRKEQDELLTLTNSLSTLTTPIVDNYPVTII